jgi:hypothetical protein
MRDTNTIIVGVVWRAVLVLAFMLSFTIGMPTAESFGEQIHSPLRQTLTK